jgi:CRISPR/Cas system-associated protein Csm6
MAFSRFARLGYSKVCYICQHVIQYVDTKKTHVTSNMDKLIVYSTTTKTGILTNSVSHDFFKIKQKIRGGMYNIAF